VVLVSGEPGVGKTRLVEELSRRAAARGFVVVWGDRGKRREHRRTTPGCRPFDGCAGRSVLSSSGHAPTARSSRSCSTTYAEPRLAILTKRASASATPSLSSCVGQPRNSREDKQNKRCCRQRPRFRASHRPRSSIRRYRPGETHQSCNRAAGARPPPAQFAKTPRPEELHQHVGYPRGRVSRPRGRTGRRSSAHRRRIGGSRYLKIRSTDSTAWPSWICRSKG
jgi:hypothetical protein